MQIHLLVEPCHLPVPDNIKIIENWGYVGLAGSTTYGDHMAIEGTEEAISDWLRPFKGVYVGRGTPQLQKFDVMHVKES